jgi:hypothetical protein
MFSPSAYDKHFIAYIDGLDDVPYFGEYKYIHLPSPQKDTESFKFHNKTFMKVDNRYFVGIDIMQLVREINAGDYRRIKARYLIQVGVEKVKKSVQLVLPLLD